MADDLRMMVESAILDGIAEARRLGAPVLRDAEWVAVESLILTSPEDRA